MTPVEKLLARQECLDLMTAYCTHLDGRNEAGLVALFEPEACLRKMSEPVHVARGHAGIAQALQARPASLLSRHLLANSHVAIEDDEHARGEAYGIVIRGLRDRDSWPMPIRGVELLVAYRMAFRRGAEGWRIADCEVHRVLDVEAAR